MTYNHNSNIYKNSSASLECINELRCAIYSAVAIVQKSFILQHQIATLKFGSKQYVKFMTWKSKKIGKPKEYEFTATMLPHKIIDLQLLV